MKRTVPIDPWRLCGNSCLAPTVIVRDLAHEARIASLEAKLAKVLTRIDALEAARKSRKKRKPAHIMDRAEREAHERIAEIGRQVSALHGVTLERLKSHDRRRVFTQPRQEAWLRCQQAGHSSTVIGRFFGGRDHTTILYGIDVARKRSRPLEAEAEKEVGR